MPDENIPTKTERLMLRGSEVAKACGYSRAKAYRMMQRGEIPIVRSGKSVRVPLDALLKWIEANTKGSAA